MAKVIEYSYLARNIKGRTEKGSMAADSKNMVMSKLQAKGLSPISINEGPAEARNVPVAISIKLPTFAKRVGSKDLAIMTRQMSTMVSAGLPLSRAISILEAQTENKRLASTLSDVRLDLQAGMTFSGALLRRSDIFPVLMTSLVEAGEAGGFLDKSLDSVAKTFENEAKLHTSIKSAMTYPVAVLLMAVVGVFAMLIFIVPIFEKMFAQLGGTLPAPTQMLVTLSPIAAWASPFIIVFAFFFASWWTRNRNATWVRQLVDPIKLNIPVFGPLNKKIALSRFSRTFSNMIGSGVPILQALSVIGKTSGNIVIENAVSRVQDSVRLGTTVSQQMVNEKVFPNMITQMISIGEYSGSLEVMLSKVADSFDEDIEATTSQLTSLIEPLMIAFIGLVIGGMVITLYLPIFSIYNVIK
jgi:type IV pilus assembly protein PilC